MLSNFTKALKASQSHYLRPQVAMFSNEYTLLSKIRLKQKFHNNRNIPDLFKNSQSDDYVSLSNLIHFTLIIVANRLEDTSAMTQTKLRICLTRWICHPSIN